MQIILKNHSLNNLNTLRCRSVAANFIELTDIDLLSEVSDFIEKTNSKFFVLGGGSNLILPEKYDGLVIYNKLSGIDCIEEHSEYVLIKAMAGVIWDEFVAYTINKGWFGLENLSLIPGTVGASPIQNIGAYGAEVADFIEYVEVYDIQTNTVKQINNAGCNFSYRNSIFKLRPNYIVIAVTFRLLKDAILNYKYADLSKCLTDITNLTALDLRNCIIKIRQAKLPDPNQIGNVGSFFHNPILNNAKVNPLKLAYPGMPVYILDDDNSKVSAGWLIDNLDLKGFRQNNLGVYPKQALVLVNYDSSTQTEVLEFARMIQDKVKAKYGISLNIEPIIISKGG